MGERRRGGSWIDNLSHFSYFFPQNIPTFAEKITKWELIIALPKNLGQISPSC